ncbi:uncharacterized protein PFL1_04545 [Pseudozyma flocculosa PF-1]|uniref:DnaJ homologue subfamily C member 28 conserved domain-containing protein n=2 Tax=Pseudozyma flocculosa TaxID=84751 RepID=A0A5C3F9H8_9BASI|nr:uncharacterized protein PFL1_04545 [Pseudozyma flocculosa PF-1]EPQ27800.1 hypothetical protein PFL1_04545 [Pseudozyma flocculosa PF-1]SPO41072.1 uncharacterized protein PSFLO_06554 [Pseudozyma flocculosa]
MGSSKLFQDALLEEGDPAANKSSASSHPMFHPDPTDVPWDGEERLQDRVLRMVMDKYKPLRIAPTEGEDLVDRKLKGVQTPTAPGVAPVTPSAPSTSLQLDETVADGEKDDRRLPRTPDAKPWRAVYVRPSHLGGTGTPNIYYGQFLQSASSSMAGVQGGGVGGPSSAARQKLKEAGVKVSQLPLDDPKAMRQIREGVKKLERVNKISRARDGVLDYRLGNRAAVFASSSSSSGASADGQEDGAAAQPKEADQLLAMGGGTRGWASVVEERIRAAQDAGLFKTNKLRGKPMERDIQERNPFLNSEEFFMNRIVKRQGAAPPWVELNAELEDEVGKFRYRLVEQWCRRAVRMVISSGSMRSGLEALDHSQAPPPAASSSGAAAPAVSPFGKERDTAPPLYSFIPPARTEGEQRTLDLAARYRDPEWLERERAYHAHEIQRLNEIVRRHNHLAPFHARKGLMSVDREIGDLYERARPELVRRLSAAIRDQSGAGRGADGAGADGKKEKEATRDVWGRIVAWGEARPTESGQRGGGWWGNSVGSAGERDSPVSYQDGRAGADEGAGRRRAGETPSLGLLVALRRTIDWAKERIGV